MTTLKVVPNPYAHGVDGLNGAGEPHTVFMYAGTNIGVGVKFKKDEATKVTSIEYQTEPATIVCEDPIQFGYYRRAIVDGELLPADAETGKIVFGESYKFADPKGIIAAAKTATLKALAANSAGDAAPPPPPKNPKAAPSGV